MTNNVNHFQYPNYFIMRIKGFRNGEFGVNYGFFKAKDADDALEKISKRVSNHKEMGWTNVKYSLDYDSNSPLLDL